MSRKPKDQNFGGWWTVQKLDAVERYLQAYTTALRYQPFETVYIDAFSGSGECKIGVIENHIKIDGSARRALRINPEFSHYIFIDSDNDKVTKLRDYCSISHPALFPKIKFHTHDTNEVLCDLAQNGFMKDKRGVIFLDPYGPSIKWNTLQNIASTKHLDVWYLFPLSAILRFAANDPEKALEIKLNEVLGTEEWKNWYDISLDNSEMLEKGSRRIFNILSLFKKQMESIFPMVMDPVILRNTTNSPMFALYFACSNPSPKAQSNSNKIASHILKMFDDDKLAQEFKPALEKLQYQNKLTKQLTKNQENGQDDLFG